MVKLKLPHWVVDPQSSNKALVCGDLIALISNEWGKKIIVTRPIIDKISLTFDVTGAEDRDAIAGILMDLSKDETSPEYTAATGKGYQVNLTLTHAESGQSVLIQAVPKSKAAFLRFEFNPTKLGPDGMAFFKERLSDFLGFNWTWDDVKQLARVTRIDVAVDFVNAHRNELVCEWDKPTKTISYVGPHGSLETTYLGMTASKKNSKFKAYNKNRQLAADDRQPKFGGVPHTRVEFRVKTNHPIAGLSKLQNPLARATINFVPRKNPHVANYAWEHFTDSAQRRGLEPALVLVPPNLRKAYRVPWKEAAPIWHSPSIWTRWADSLDAASLA
jgi:hypothetical protein